MRGSQPAPYRIRSDEIEVVLFSQDALHCVKLSADSVGAHSFSLDESSATLLPAWRKFGATAAAAFAAYFNEGEHVSVRSQEGGATETAVPGLAAELEALRLESKTRGDDAAGADPTAVRRGYRGARGAGDAAVAFGGHPRPGLTASRDGADVAEAEDEEDDGANEEDDGQCSVDESVDADATAITTVTEASGKKKHPTHRVRRRRKRELLAAIAAAEAAAAAASGGSSVAPTAAAAAAQEDASISAVEGSPVFVPQSSARARVAAGDDTGAGVGNGDARGYNAAGRAGGEDGTGASVASSRPSRLSGGGSAGMATHLEQRHQRQGQQQVHGRGDSGRGRSHGSAAASGRSRHNGGVTSTCSRSRWPAVEQSTTAGSRVPSARGGSQDLATPTSSRDFQRTPRHHSQQQQQPQRYSESGPDFRYGWSGNQSSLHATGHSAEIEGGYADGWRSGAGPSTAAVARQHSGEATDGEYYYTPRHGHQDARSFSPAPSSHVGYPSSSHCYQHQYQHHRQQQQHYERGNAPSVGHLPQPPLPGDLPHPALHSHGDLYDQHGSVGSQAASAWQPPLPPTPPPAPRMMPLPASYPQPEMWQQQQQALRYAAAGSVASQAAAAGQSHAQVQPYPVFIAVPVPVPAQSAGQPSPSSSRMMMHAPMAPTAAGQPSMGPASHGMLQTADGQAYMLPWSSAGAYPPVAQMQQQQQYYLQQQLATGPIWPLWQQFHQQFPATAAQQDQAAHLYQYSGVDGVAEPASEASPGQQS